MERPMATATITLDDIDALFTRMGDQARLYLIDHLADKLDYATDDFTTAVQNAAREIADLSLYGRGEDQIDAYADTIVPQGNAPVSAWKEHRAKRDAELGYYLAVHQRRAAA